MLPLSCTLHCGARYRLKPEFPRDPNLFGISLHTAREQETIPPLDRESVGYFKPHTQLGVGDTPFLMQMPCSWGAVYFPEHWRTFRRYMGVRSQILRLHLMTSATNEWAGSWVKWFYEMIFFKGWYMLYPNYPDERSFSTNHAEAGVHISAQAAHSNADLFTVPLITAETYVSPNFAAPTAAPLLDMFKHRVRRAELRARGHNLVNNDRPAWLCKCGYADCSRAVAVAIGEAWTPQVGWQHGADDYVCNLQLKMEAKELAKSQAAAESDFVEKLHVGQLQEMHARRRELASSNTRHRSHVATTYLPPAVAAHPVLRLPPGTKFPAWLAGATCVLSLVLSARACAIMVARAVSNGPRSPTAAASRGGRNGGSNGGLWGGSGLRHKLSPVPMVEAGSGVVGNQGQPLSNAAEPSAFLYQEQQQRERFVGSGVVLRHSSFDSAEDSEQQGVQGEPPSRHVTRRWEASPRARRGAETYGKQVIS